MNKPKLLNNSSFKTFFSSYVRDFLVDPNLLNYTNEKFLSEKKFILSNFQGELQQFAIVKFINDYNTFALTENLYNLIKEYKPKLTNSSHLEKVRKLNLNLITLKYNYFKPL